MKKKIIAIVIGILCVIVAAIGLFQFAFKTKATYVKDVDSDKFNKAYDLLANAYLEDGEEADVYYTDFIKKNTEAGEGEHKATLTNGVDSVKYYEENNNEDNQLPEDVKTYSDKMIELEYQKSANNNTTSTTVATGDFSPMACGAAAILAGVALVVFARKREA